MRRRYLMRWNSLHASKKMVPRATLNVKNIQVSRVLDFSEPLREQMLSRPHRPANTFLRDNAPKCFPEIVLHVGAHRTKLTQTFETPHRCPNKLLDLMEETRNYTTTLLQCPQAAPATTTANRRTCTSWRSVVMSPWTSDTPLGPS